MIEEDGVDSRIGRFRKELRLVDQDEERVHRPVPEIDDFRHFVIDEQRIDQVHLALNGAEIGDDGFLRKTRGEDGLVRVGVEAKKRAVAGQEIIAKQTRDHALADAARGRTDDEDERPRFHDGPVEEFTPLRAP